MREQTFYIENYNSFEPKHIFECGQCFRWNRESDDSYTGVFGRNILNVKKEKQKIVFKGICENSIIKTCIDYFDLDRDYDKIKTTLSIVDDSVANSITYGYGIRILKQDLWECIISFIISANNNIPRIKGIIERLSQKYGQAIEYKRSYDYEESSKLVTEEGQGEDSRNNNKTYYTFPTPEELSVATVQNLRELGLGFRDKRVFETTKIILEKQLDLNELLALGDISLIREELIKLPGVGEKVADCIMLFGMNKLEVFPVDVWVRRVMNELYIKNEEEEKVNKEEIRKLAYEKYAELAGIAQQYLFYWKRDA